MSQPVCKNLNPGASLIGSHAGQIGLTGSVSKPACQIFGESCDQRLPALLTGDHPPRELPVGGVDVACHPASR